MANQNNDDFGSDITVGELKEALSNFPDDALVCFGPNGQFTYYRVKDRGVNGRGTQIAHIEFNEINEKNLTKNE